MLFASFLYAQDTNIETSILSSSLANDEVVYTLGDIQIDETSGSLGAISFLLFYEESVSVETPFTTDIKVYPNPTNNYITVASDETIETIKITDTQGREILSTTNSQDIDLSEIASGIYIIIINGKNAFKISKQ